MAGLATLSEYSSFLGVRKQEIREGEEVLMAKENVFSGSLDLIGALRVGKF